MSFINQALLFGLGAIAIPIILHLLNRRSAKQIEWGAMQFLLDSIEARRRRIQLEEALLLAARCLLCGLIALTVARPFQPPGGQIPYVVVLPAFLLSLVCITTAIILRGNKKYLFSLLFTGLALLALSVAAILYEKYWNTKRFGTAGRKDIVLIIDGSTSMQLKQAGVSNFDRAIQEAKQVVEKSSGGNAFSVILGGPTPMVRVGDPVVNKNDLDLALNSLRPARGKMDAFGALTTALTALNRGGNPNKEIIVFTDGQSIGWNLDNRSSWEALSKGAGQLKTKPPILYRKFGLPSTFRNVSAAQMRLSRDIIGTDRQVTVEVMLENTGSEAISPTGVRLVISPSFQGLDVADAASAAGGTPKPAGPDDPVVLKDMNVGQLQPGSRIAVPFKHKFAESGSYYLKAQVLVQDDLGLDDQAQMAVNVVDKLSVLIVEGNPTAEVLKRASPFTFLALNPAKNLPNPAGQPNQPPKSDEKAKPGVLLEPDVKTLGQASALSSFSPYDVIVLCDVPKLSDTVARRLASWVQAGGGLLIAPGATADANFYNNWRTADGVLLTPAKFTSQWQLQPGQEPAVLALNTFTHSALKLVADAKQSDLGTTALVRYWRQESDPVGDGAAFAAGRLGNGDPFLTIRQSGYGMTMLSAVSFDTGGGNLPTRQAFVPLVHQLVYHLASPDGQPLHRQPSPQVNIPLGSSTAEGGLKGEYFRGRNFRGPPVSVRIDPTTEMNFADREPAAGVGRDDFSVRWTGALVPRYTDEYVFNGSGDDHVDVWIADKQVIRQGGEGRFKLEAGKFYPIRVELEESNGNASYQLYWRTNNGQLQAQQIIPSDCLMPFPPDTAEKEAVVGAMEAMTPDNARRAAQLVFTRGGLSARLSGDVIPGPYRLTVPKERQKEYQRLLARDGVIPFSIADDPAESRLTEMNDRDIGLIKSQFEFLQPKNAEDISNILAGREFGEELWKYLALGALFILLAEIALTRWIAYNRRSGEEVVLNFETKFQAPKQFQEQLNRIRQVTTAN